MDTNPNQFSKLKLWLISKWQWIAGIFGAILFFAVSLLRLSNHNKRNIENIRETHDKEKKVIEDSNDKLIEGLESIRKKDRDLDSDIHEKFDKKEKELETKKKELEEDSVGSETLGKDLADRLGVDFVTTEDENN